MPPPPPCKTVSYLGNKYRNIFKILYLLLHWNILLTKDYENGTFCCHVTLIVAKVWRGGGGSALAHKHLQLIRSSLEKVVQSKGCCLFLGYFIIYFHSEITIYISYNLNEKLSHFRCLFWINITCMSYKLFRAKP